MSMSTTVSGVVEVGEVVWLGETLACPECGGRDRWRLSTEGGDAWADCAAGHRLAHPLVYPALVAFVAAAGGAEAAGAQHALTHTLGARTDDGPWWWPHSPATGQTWQRWPADDPAWTTWPALAAARDRADAVSAWAATTADVDTSLAWTLAWGCTDPDRITIALR